MGYGGHTYELFTEEQAAELLAYYNDGFNLSVVAMYEDEQSVYPTVKFFETDKLSIAIDTLRMTLIFAYIDYIEFIDERYLIRTKEIETYLYKEINRRLHTKFKDEIKVRHKASQYAKILEEVQTQAIDPYEETQEQHYTKYRIDATQKKQVGTHTLHRIVAQTAFTLANGVNIQETEYGGYIEDYTNLAQEGCCWVTEEACVYEQARVREDAIITEQAQVYGSAQVYGKSVISGSAQVTESAKVMGRAEIQDQAVVSGQAKVGNAVRVREQAYVAGKAVLGKHVEVRGQTRLVDKGPYIEQAQIEEKEKENKTVDRPS